MEQYKLMDFVIIQDPREEKHFHADTELIYVVIGNIDVRIMDRVYHLNKNDVLAVNSGIEHQISKNEGAIVCIVRYSDSLLVSLYGAAENIFFQCCSAEDMQHSYDRIRSLFQELIREYLKRSGRNECTERAIMYQLLACLTGEFMIMKEKRQEGEIQQENDRLREILRYIGRNFNGSISLSELAERMYTSSSTLSRFFKKQTGVYFADYVNQVRLKHAVQRLIYSEDSITKIAVDSGFSNLSVFSRLFKEEYEMTPNEYRKREKKERPKLPETENQLTEKLLNELQEQKETEERISVTVDTFERQKYKKVWGQTINVGSISTMLMANTQYHVLYLSENLGFRYVRLWNLFSTQMLVTDGVHPDNYSFDQLDIVLDFLDQHKIFPFLDFGLRPRAAVYNVRDFVYYDEENVEFQNREVWEKAVEGFVRHVLVRYGQEKVRNWIFELSYDIQHKTPCYRADNYSFLNAYEFLYHTVKDNVPDAEVGGPMAITELSDSFLSEFLESAKTQKCIPDFVSILLFPYVSEDKKDGLLYGRTVENSYEVNEVSRIRSLINSLGLDCRLYVSEWNPTISSRNYLNDSCFRASYFVKKTEELLGLTDMINVWMASDWVSNYFDVRGLANGGNGLLTKDTICKPAYYALQFLSAQGSYLLARGENYIVTGKERGGYYVLLFNYKMLKGDYFLSSPKSEDPEQIRIIYDNEKAVEIEIALKPMRAEKYVVKKRVVSPGEGSLLWEWRKFDYDNTLTAQEIKYIRQICFPRISMKRQVTTAGELRIRETVGPHEIMLIHIYEDKKR